MSGLVTAGRDPQGGIHESDPSQMGNNGYSQ